MTHTDAERADFEAWLAPEHSREKWHTGEYTDDTVYSMFAAWQASRRAQVVPQGWKLVPEVADEKMQRAIAAQFNGTAREAIDAWSEALAAAPQPPEATVNQSLTVDSAQLDDTNVADIAQAVDSKEAAPVQMPEPWGVAIGDRIWVGRPPAHVPKIAEHEGLPLLKLYTEHQVRQLLAAQEQSNG